MVAVGEVFVHRLSSSRPNGIGVLSNLVRDAESGTSVAALFVDSELELPLVLNAIEMAFRFCDGVRCQFAVMLSFRPECDDGIDLGGTARGNEAGKE